MCGFQDALSNLMPIDWMDPYGRTPFAKDAELSVDITIVETDDGIRAKSVKNPPTSGSSRLMTAIKNALGMGLIDSCDPCSSQQDADQGKQKNMINKDNKEESGTMEPSSPEGSGDRDRNPSSQGSPGSSRYGATEKEDEEKAPRFK